MSRSIAQIVEQHIAAGRTPLPVFDATAQKLQELLRREDFEISEVEEILGADPALSAAVLRLANSSFFSGLDKVVAVPEAVMRIGVKQIVNLVTMITQKAAYRVSDADLQPIMASLWAHSVGCAIGSQWLAERLRRRELAAEAFMAGMLHDIGKLYVLRVVSDLRRANASFDPPLTLVQEMVDKLHTAQGEALLAAWNLPDVYCRIVRAHHDAEFDEEDALLAMVRLADQACNRLGIGLRPGSDVNPATSAEAHALRASEVLLAELEIRLEDALELSEIA